MSHYISNTKLIVGIKKGKKQIVRRTIASVLVSSAITVSQNAHAFAFTFDNPDLTGDFNTTLSYTGAYRLRPAGQNLLFGPTNPAAINQDDGNNAFRHRGIVENRFAIFSEMDMKYMEYGFRISGEAYYDTMYNRHNANNSAFTSNNLSVSYNQFTDATTTVKGKQAQLLDAFVYGSRRVGNIPISVRIGQLAQEWGETLFFGANGIAGGMVPVDVDKLFSDPSAEFKQIVMPVPQATISAQLPYHITLGAYYQFRWRSDQLPPAGSYFSSSDILGQGAESFYLPIPGFPSHLVRANDQAGKDTGQFGFQLRFSPTGWNTDFGLYWIRFNAKDPEIYANPEMGNYRLVYGNGVRSFGASFSTTLGDANVAGEVSIRENMPLMSDVVLDFSGRGNNTGNVLFATGKTAHANLSMLYSVPPTPFWRDAVLMAEVGWNRRLSIDANAQTLDPNATRDAIGVQFVFSPNYYQVLPGLDISVPIGLGYNPVGKSSVVGFNGGGYHTGVFTLGVKGAYERVWNVALRYTRYLGAGQNFLDSAGHYTYGQSLADRDFVSLTLSRSF
ncbi:MULTISPECIES: DUF1302 domain-containing protein [unclassified Burkholderia]|uniref:DUF1302 domain-containing protein n=1 Tax=unclassified Burkholderia TaxID=2613784 RepID=UPI002AB13C9C|nr:MULTISPECIES: DUF1302 family protein [unclassified Burkholderia]